MVDYLNELMLLQARAMFVEKADDIQSATAALARIIISAIMACVSGQGLSWAT